MEKVSLYIHLPFCERKCYYCDFNSFKTHSINIDLYIENLIKELNLYEDTLKNYSIGTVFIGGGTPSSIDDKYITKIMKSISKVFNTENLTEITIEVNPGTLSRDKALSYKKAGINRISIGLQSLNNNLLKSIGRIHNKEDFYNTLNTLRDVGFDNINVDLMFGLPSQTMDDLLDTLNEVISLKLEHISLYGLIIEEGTLFNRWYRKGLLDLPDEDLEREMYHKSVEILKINNYEHYEISNFAKLGKKSLHNQVYWNVEPYIGIGLGSHSNLLNMRFWNYSDFKKYNDSLRNGLLPIEGDETIKKDMEIAEYCIMNLRLNDGINKDKFELRFNIDINSLYGDIILKHIKDDLLEDNNENIKLTKKGLDLSNLVEVDFMP